MGAWHLMRGWGDTSAVIARCFPARGGGAICTVPRKTNGREGALGRRGCGGRGDTAVVAGQEHRAASCQGGGGSWGRRNARVLITLPVSRADTR